MENDLGIRLDRRDEGRLSKEQLDEFLARLREIAREYGYKLEVSGYWHEFAAFVLDEKNYIQEKFRNHGISPDMSGLWMEAKNAS